MRKLLVIVSLLSLAGVAMAVPQTQGWMSPTTRFEPTFRLATLDQGWVYYLPESTFQVSIVHWPPPDTFLLATKFHPYNFQDPLGYKFGYPLWIIGLSVCFFEATDPGWEWDNDQFKFVVFANDGKTKLYESGAMAATKNDWTNFLLPDSIRVNSGDFWVAVQRVGTNGFPTLGFAVGYWMGHSYIRNRLWVPLNSSSIGLPDPGEWCLEAFVNYTPTAVDEKPSIGPLALDLSGSPAHGRVEVRYTLAEAGVAALTVYDVSGRPVAQLASGAQAAGTHAVVWNGTDRSGAKVPSGAYLCRLSAAGTSVVKKVLLVQ